MPQANVWFANNDMRVRLDSLQSSTMASTAYLNSSTGVSVDIWQALSTGTTGDRVVTGTNMPYSTGSNGRYEAVIQSTVHSMAVGTVGMAVITVDHSGLDGEWRRKFRVDYRRST